MLPKEQRDKIEELLKQERPEEWEALSWAEKEMTINALAFEMDKLQRRTQRHWCAGNTVA